ncbi:MAG: S8 family serine peptidase [Cyclobacteriaceae bacterium]
MLKFWFTITKLTFLLLVIQSYGFAQEIHRDKGKSSPHLFHNSVSSSYHVMVNDSSGFKAWMIQSLPNAVIKSDPALKNVYRISSLAKKDLEKLLEAPELRFVEVATRYPSVESDVPGLDLTVNAINAVHHLYPSLTGEGLRVLVKENAFDKNDIDLVGRVYKHESVPDVYDPHATAMATIISGAGNTSQESKGVAWKSNPGFSDFGNLMPESTAGLITNGISVQNHSYGVGVENFYGIESHAYDKQCVEYPRIVHVFSAGNSGMDAANSGLYDGITGYANLTGQFKIAKNIIAVGSIDQSGVIEPVSSRGPASDGRIKPVHRLRRPFLRCPLQKLQYWGSPRFAAFDRC